MPHEAAAEQGAEARPLLPRFKACGRKGTAACAETRTASPRRCKRSRRRPACRPTIARRASLAGGTSKKPCAPPAGRARPVGQQSTSRTALHEPRGWGSGVGASASNPPMYRRRQSRSWPRGKERRREAGPASAACSDSWGIASPTHTAQPKRSADCTSGAKRAEQVTTINGRRGAPSLTTLGGKPGGICGKRAWASTGAAPPRRPGAAAAATAGEKPRRHPVCRHPAALYSALSGDQGPLPRHCRVDRERPANDWAASCVKGGTHPENLVVF